MKIAEINRSVLKKMFNENINAVLAEDYFILYDETQIKNAFNHGSGTKQDFIRYANNNRQYCIYYDIEQERFF